jgi:hypothetical protein
MSNNFSINFAERLHGADGESGFYHSFLAFLPEEDVTGEFAHQAQKLHFDDDISGAVFMPNVRVGLSEKWEQGLNLEQRKTGIEIELLPLWNHVLQHAQRIKTTSPVFFDATRTNCTSGAIRGLESMGLEFHHEFTEASVGVERHDFPTLAPFDFDASNPAHTDLQEMRRVNQELVSSLLMQRVQR